LLNKFSGANLEVQTSSCSKNVVFTRLFPCFPKLIGLIMAKNGSRMSKVKGALGFGTTGGAATGGDATPLAAGAGCSCGQG